jgi:hypothetical protein
MSRRKQQRLATLSIHYHHTTCIPPYVMTHEHHDIDYRTHSISTHNQHSGSLWVRLHSPLLTATTQQTQRLQAKHTPSPHCSHPQIHPLWYVRTPKHRIEEARGIQPDKRLLKSHPRVNGSTGLGVNSTSKSTRTTRSTHWDEKNNQCAAQERGPPSPRLDKPGRYLSIVTRTLRGFCPSAMST